MLLLIDRAGVAQFAYRTSSIVADVRRYYVAAAPRLAVLVCRYGLALADLAGQVVDAQIGYEDAWREFARPGCEGLQHTKITIYRIVRREHRRTLSQVLAASPKGDR